VCKVQNIPNQHKVHISVCRQFRVLVRFLRGPRVNLPTCLDRQTKTNKKTQVGTHNAHKIKQHMACLFVPDVWALVISYCGFRERLALSQTSSELQVLTDQKQWALCMARLRLSHNITVDMGPLQLVIHRRQLPWQQNIAWLAHCGEFDTDRDWPRMELFLRYLHPDGVYSTEYEDTPLQTLTLGCCSTWRWFGGDEIIRLAWRPGNDLPSTAGLQPNRVLRLDSMVIKIAHALAACGDFCGSRLPSSICEIVEGEVYRRSMYEFTI
jgi:hypothetical protein